MNDYTEQDKLSFDVPDELGEVVDFHTECPSVYYIAANIEIEYQLFDNKYYVVTDEATMTSPAASAYGEKINGGYFSQLQLNYRPAQKFSHLPAGTSGQKTDLKRLEMVV